MRVLSIFAAVAAAILPRLVNSQTVANDVVHGLPVITNLDIKTLDSSKIHRYYFKASEDNSGAPVYVPVWVARGPNASSGKTMFLSTGVHGDELNGIRVLQKVLADLDPSKLNGTVIGVPGVNVLGMALNTRFVPEASSDNGPQLIDLNRVWPGNATLAGGGTTAAFAYNIWSGLTQNGTQVDVAIDIHTQSIGAYNPLWCYSDWRNPGAKLLSQLIGADVVKIDPGQEGSLETTFVERGIPAITFEIGSAKVWQQDYIERSHQFILRALAAWNIRSGYGVPPVNTTTYFADSFWRAYAETGGFFEPAVELLQDVKQGQFLGTLYNTFGDVLSNYTAGVDGRVQGITSDPAREPGSTLVTILYNSTNPADAMLRRQVAW